MKHLLLTNARYQELLKGFEDFLYTRGYGRSSCYNLPHHCREFLYFLESRGLEALSLVEAPDLESFLAYLQNRDNERQGGALSAAYLNKYLQALRLFARYLYQSHQLRLSLPFGQYKKEAVPKVILGHSEIEALYAACSRDALGQRDRAMLSLYYGCGLRREEGESLDLSDFQPENKLLYVRPGKNGKDRYVPLTARIKADLLTYRDRGRGLLLTRGTCEAFLVRAPGQRVKGASLFMRLKRLALLSGIGKDISLHTLRHSIATHLWQAGMSLEQVGRFLGHRSLESTQVYTHIKKEEAL